MDQNLPLVHWRILQPRSVTEPLAEVLQKARNIKDPSFFRFSYEQGIHDPYLFLDMEKAVDRIVKAIDNKEGIIVAGDYDLDGISGTAVLLDFFRHIGYPVHFKLPHRVKDGYGLSAKTVVEAKKEKIGIIITVDNGISCFQEITLAQSLGVDVIITDHHTIPEKIPPAFAILHPKIETETYPDRELTGSGVAYKLACALAKRLLTENDAIAFSKWALDLATLGTIADMGSLVGENRQIVYYGLQVLSKQRRPGIRGLLEIAGHNDPFCTAETVGFKLGPRLNAAGRMAEASLSLQLLLAIDPIQAQSLVIALEELNTERKKVAESAFLLADNLVQKQDTAGPILVACSDSFHPGVIGLAASKLAEKYQRPVAILEQREDVIVGSMRSIPQVDLMEVIEEMRPYLLRAGGHAQAAGFSLALDQKDAFIKAINEFCSYYLPLPPRELLLDTEIFPQDITLETHSSLDKFEPFGIGNAKPLFLLRNLQPLKVQPLGTEKKHWKVQFQHNESGQMVTAIAFNTDQNSFRAPIDAAVRMNTNRWNDNVSVQLIIETTRPAQN